MYCDRTPGEPAHKSMHRLGDIEGKLTQIIKVSFITARFVNLSATKDRKRSHLAALSTAKHYPCKQILDLTGGQFESLLVNTTFLNNI